MGMFYRAYFDAKLTRLTIRYRRLRKAGRISKLPFFEDVSSSPKGIA
jgi:hypothetical protein